MKLEYHRNDINISVLKGTCWTSAHCWSSIYWSSMLRGVYACFIISRKTKSTLFSEWYWNTVSHKYKVDPYWVPFWDSHWGCGLALPRPLGSTQSCPSPRAGAELRRPTVWQGAYLEINNRLKNNLNDLWLLLQEGRKAYTHQNEQWPCRGENFWNEGFYSMSFS